MSDPSAPPPGPLASSGSAPSRVPASDLPALLGIGKPHGLQGDLLAYGAIPEPVDPEDLLLDRDLVVRRGDRAEGTVRLESLRPFKDGWIVTLAGVEDRETAETWRGVDLCIPREDLPPLPDGWYWESDLEGATVVDPRYGELGRAAGLDFSAPQARLRVEPPAGPPIFIPWVNALVPVVDVPARRIETRLPLDFPGLAPEPD